MTFSDLLLKTKLYCFCSWSFNCHTQSCLTNIFWVKEIPQTLLALHPAAYSHIPIKVPVSETDLSSLEQSWLQTSVNVSRNHIFRRPFWTGVVTNSTNIRKRNKHRVTMNGRHFWWRHQCLQIRATLYSILYATINIGQIKLVKPSGQTYPIKPVALECCYVMIDTFALLHGLWGKL